MILQRSYAVVDCPVCGRPVEIQSRHHGHEFACGHCRGQFVVYETDDGLIAAKLEGGDALERAEQLLRHSVKDSDSALFDLCQRLRSAVMDDEGHAEGWIDTSLEIAGREVEQRPTALLVEHRDEVFARIATDLAESEMRVVRAKSATEAVKLCGKYDPTLVVANMDLPDRNGWLLARNLGLFDRRIRVWLYQPFQTKYDEGMAKYVHADEWLVYGGDLLGLSETIVELMTA